MNDFPKDNPEPAIQFLCPECGSHHFSEGCFVETMHDPKDPWSDILQRYTCAQCGYVIPGHLAELWNGITPDAAAQEWKQIFRTTADRRRV